MAASVRKQLRAFGAHWFALPSFVLAAAPAYAQLGSEVTNIADIVYEANGVEFGLKTNPATFILEAQRTPSTVEFFRPVSPSAPDAIVTRVPDSHYSPEAQLQGPFIPIGPARTLGGMELDLTDEAILSSADRYIPGELLVVSVEDAGQNGDPTRIETVAVEVTASSGDSIVICLFESGEDTGEFFAWLPTTDLPSPVNDPELGVAEGDTLTATYVDAFDATEVSVDTALVDPFGRLFDSATGELIDNVSVTVVDVATGEPAEVFGVDGGLATLKTRVKV